MCTQAHKDACGSDLVQVSAVIPKTGERGVLGERGRPEAGDVRRRDCTLLRFPLKAQAERF